MLILGIETSCDETAAAVVEETGDLVRPWADRSNVIASQIPFTASGRGGAGASRQHIRDICGVGALDEAGTTWNDLGAVAVTGPACGIPAGRRFVRENRRRGIRPAAGRRASPGGSHRVAGVAERRASASRRRARRVGRAHEPVSHRASRRLPASEPDTRRCRGRSVRQGRQAAGTRISGWADR